MSTPPPNRYEHAPRLPDGETVDVRTLVPGATRIEVEIGPGRGMFLRERVLARDDVGVVGFEIKRKWAAIVDGRLAKEGLAPRARVFAEDAKEALPRVGPGGSVSAFFVLFPDPWWKKRHAKRLVVGEVLLAEAARLLAPDGELFIQTDVDERAAEYERAVAAHGGFAPAGDDDGSPRMRENPYVAKTNREKRADADGLPVHRMRWLAVSPRER